MEGIFQFFASRYSRPYPIAKSSPNSILRVWCQPTGMKKILVLAIVLVAINQ